ncbi:hypothetical protein BUALT_Bualt01G0142100 [Buddleja alternifolia]|uniref:TF-B3 domain-containing protein n=1 Tax=Buddleja alternifolia TaxID=168488 RepID=A0AAV6Y715_9LAMI|nr:hypothetical protein BUALT_Bualt01G0142100 [Buddleja alternifolia]
MAGNRNDILNFFKFMFGPTWQQHMALPPLFVERANASIGDLITIHTHKGATAFMLQEISDGHLAISGSAWHEFISAHNIHETYVLLFIHRGNMHFNVTIFDQTGAVVESGDDGDNDDASDDNEEAEDVIDVGDYAETDGEDDIENSRMFCVKVPKSSGYNYRHSRLARLYLLDFNLANLKVPTAGQRTWSVNLKWINLVAVDGTASPQTFALKEGWLEFANANRVRGGDICVFEMKEEVGNTINMDVVIERRGRLRWGGNMYKYLISTWVC